MDANVLELRIREWLPIFEAQAKSGLNKTEWCEKNGIRRWEFYKRLKDCRRYMLEKTEKSPGFAASLDAFPSFVEVPVNPGQIAEPALENICNKDPGRISISCGKFRISLEGSVDQDVLATVIREVSHAKC